jgi:hypothetical protein
LQQPDIVGQLTALSTMDQECISLQQLHDTIAQVTALTILSIAQRNSFKQAPA